MAKQIEKFYRKWNKGQADIHLLHQQELERQKQIREAEAQVVPGEKKMAEQGGIKEAAAVISYEGMNVFYRYLLTPSRMPLKKYYLVILKKKSRRKSPNFYPVH